jgi:hypothetical protein
MKVEMAIVKKQYRQTRALEPHMMEKPFPFDERWADRLEHLSRGRIRRVVKAQEQEEPRRPRGRPRKTKAAE